MNSVQSEPQQNEPTEAAQKPKLSVHVSDNRLLVFMKVEEVPPDYVLTEDEIQKFLAANNVVYGLCTDAIHKFCQQKNYARDLLCAKGLAPVDEKAAELKYLFRTEGIGMPNEKEDGTVDYRDLGTVQNVKKGEPLCRILMPPPGKDGMDVFGHVVPCHRCRPPSFPQGRNTIVTEDGLELQADVDGCIEYRKGFLGVNQTYVVHGNVDNASGNINFIGTVIVQGDVSSGFVVKAGGDINVHGVAEGANLEAGGNISITDGINGMDGGKITAVGDVKAKYIQNANVECGGTICTDVLMNSNVKAGTEILMRGRKGSIMGGISCAGKQIYAKEIGTDKDIRTDVTIKSDHLHELMMGESDTQSKIAAIYTKISAEKSSIATLKDKLAIVKRAVSGGNTSPEIQLVMKTLLQSQNKSEEKIKKFEDEIGKIKETPDESVTEYNVLGTKIIHSGTKISIGDFNILLNNDYSCSKFYISDGQIISGPLLPSDRKDY